jgi:hypothetical protein
MKASRYVVPANSVGALQSGTAGASPFTLQSWSHPCRWQTISIIKAYNQPIFMPKYYNGGTKTAEKWAINFRLPLLVNTRLLIFPFFIQ